jgi:hydrogenase small subunit
MDSISFAGIKVKADTVGKIAGTATALGIGAHLAANLITKRVGLGKTNSPQGGDSVDKTGASSN